MDSKSLSPADKWIWAGIPAMFAIGTLFHFLYELLGGSPAAGILAPVNESVWEHGKLALWPGAIWWFLGWVLRKPAPRETEARRWFSGALASLLAGVAAVSLLYYFYTQAFGLERLWADILILLAADALGQGLGLHLWRRGRPRSGVRLLLLFLALFLLFLYLTYFPPHIPWFQDGPTGGYGPL